MTSPMPELPDHFPVPVDEQGRGPVGWDEAVSVVCWCGIAECPELDD